MPHLISVIVPVYNSRPTLTRCVDSLLVQTYHHVEIILIDDGSNDASGDICDRYSKKYERVRTIHQVNGGVSHARNEGIKNCMGDYLCFVDSDDFVDESYVQNFVNGLSTNTDLVFQGISEVHTDGRVVKKVPEERIYQYENVLDGISDINKYAMFGYVCNKLYRRSIIEENHLRFDTNISLSEDRVFALHYMRFVNEMSVVSASSYYYELKSTGLTMKGRSYEELKMAADENLLAAIELLKTCESVRFWEDTQRMYIMNSMGYLTALFLHDNSNFTIIREISSFKAKYKDWLPLYKPVSTNHKVLYFSLKLPDILTVSVMKLYWFLKELKHGATLS